MKINDLESFYKIFKLFSSSSEHPFGDFGVISFLDNKSLLNLTMTSVKSYTFFKKLLDSRRNIIEEKRINEVEIKKQNFILKRNVWKEKRNKLTEIERYNIDLDFTHHLKNYFTSFYSLSEFTKNGACSNIFILSQFESILQTLFSKFTCLPTKLFQFIEIIFESALVDDDDNLFIDYNYDNSLENLKTDGSSKLCNIIKSNIVKIFRVFNHSKSFSIDTEIKLVNFFLRLDSYNEELLDIMSFRISKIFDSLDKIFIRDEIRKEYFITFRYLFRLNYFNKKLNISLKKESDLTFHMKVLTFLKEFDPLWTHYLTDLYKMTDESVLLNYTFKFYSNSCLLFHSIQLVSSEKMVSKGIFELLDRGQYGFLKVLILSDKNKYLNSIEVNTGNNMLLKSFNYYSEHNHEFIKFLIDNRIDLNVINNKGIECRKGFDVYILRYTRKSDKPIWIFLNN